MREAMLWKPLKGRKVQCHLCSHFCVIMAGKRGKCGVRENRDGTLHALTYGKVAALNVDPVEKKPLYHFLPGTRTFSFAAMGCNLSCRFCQNHSLSQPPRQGMDVRGEQYTPEELVQGALRSGSASISYTYSEPTIFFEMMLETARIAHENKLKNIMVSNGFMSPECLDMLGPHIDAINVDLKGFTEQFYKETCGAKLQPVLDNLRHIRRLGWWLEVTTLLIPEGNDDMKSIEGIAGFIAKELGTETPWHLSRFHPDYRMTDRAPTSVTSLEKAREIGLRHGLKYVYIGNVPGSDFSSTICPGCGRALIERHGFSTGRKEIRQGACTHCGAKIAGIGMG